MAYKKGQDRRQRVLFPDCIDEYVEADAPVRLFDAFVDNLKMDELGFVRSTPAETGTPGYDPRDFLKLYIYGYFYQVRSSRKLARECKCNSLDGLLKKIGLWDKRVLDYADKSNVCIFINTEAIKYHSRLRDESNFILKCEFNAVFVQIVNNKIYGVEYGLFGRYGMKEDLSLREYMDAM